MGKRKVLIVDDEEHFIKLAKMNLEKTQNYEVMTLSDGKQVLPALHNFRPDILLLDVLMPKITGLEICEMLNNDEIGKKVPIIIISALDRSQDKLKAFKLGVVDYAVKPLEVNELIEKIEKALRFK